jgi:hypothetical protein|tara:strand:+ start:115 stop:492 length:378 start_codon:yes stop_codon:yes gene_type:complete
MTDFTNMKKMNSYDFMQDFLTMANSIRYPPGSNIPKGLVNTSKLKEKLSSDDAILTPKLENFTEMYRQMAASLLNMSVDKLIPPGHPLYSKDHSLTLLKEENEKILKENLELKKKLKNQDSKSNI